MAMFIDKLLNSDGEIKVKNIKKKQKNQARLIWTCGSQHLLLQDCTI